MATAHLRLGGIRGRADTGSTIECYSGPPRIGEDITPTSGSVTTTITGRLGEVWSITALGSNLTVVPGIDPDAAEELGWIVLDGQTYSLSVAAEGEKIAVRAL